MKRYLAFVFLLLGTLLLTSILSDLKERPESNYNITDSNHSQTVPRRNQQLHKIISKRQSTSKVTPPKLPTQEEDFLKTLPDGRLKEDIKSLNPEAQENAKHILSKLRPHDRELNDIQVDSEGWLYYSCRFHDKHKINLSSLSAAEAAEQIDLHASPSEATQDSVPISSPPILHSRPGAPNTMFLDFNGAIVENTAWNDNPNYGNVSSWKVLPWSLDNDRTTFSDAEQNAIREIWQRVAEDFAPFDVNITTEEPQTFSNRISHCIICPTIDADGIALPHNGWGGYAYTSAFGAPDFASRRNVSWVTDMAVYNIAETCSHELGHNVGLGHDGDSIETYHDGHPEIGDVMSWSSIMGGGFYKQMSQWSKGEYYDSNNSQDDLSVIDSYLNTLDDDHSNTSNNATVLTVKNHINVSSKGLIERTGDIDVFSFQSGSGDITISAMTKRNREEPWSGNLDIILELYDAQDQLLASDNPIGGTDAEINYTTTTSATYYLHVKPTGAGSPLDSDNPTGYTSYGSLGTYNISGQIISPYPVAPEAKNDYIRLNSANTTVDASQGVLINDRDLNNYQLSAFLEVAPIHGDLIINEDGSFTYSQTGDFSESDHFVYRVTNSKGLSSTATAVISIKADHFPGEDEELPKAFTTIGDQFWFIDNSNSSEGSHSLRSGDILDNDSSTLQFQGTTAAGLLTFEYKTSSEQNFDFLEVYIDNMAEPVLEASGDTEWQTFEYDLSAGEHIIKFIYSKDTSFSKFDDCAWIDNFSLPPVTHTVNFQLQDAAQRIGGGLISQEIFEGFPATAPTLEVNDGWIFNGWNMEFNSVSEDITVQGLFERQTHTVTFEIGQLAELQSGTLIQSVEHGRTAISPVITPIPGYIFTGWDTSLENITGETSINALYEVEFYNVQFNSGPNGKLNGRSQQFIEPGETSLPVEAIPNTWYQFQRWSDGSTDNPRTFANIQNHHNITAEFVQQQVPVKISSLTIADKNSTAVNIISLSFVVTSGLPQNYKIANGTWAPLPEPDQNGFYRLNNIDISHIPALEGNKTLNFTLKSEVSENNFSGKVKLLIPKASSIKFAGSTKISTTTAPVSFKINGHAENYQIFWLDNGQEKELLTGSISSEAIINHYFTTPAINLSEVTSIKGKKVIYVRLSNQVGVSLPTKGTVTVKLPKASSVKINGNNKTGRNNVPVSFKIIGDADSYRIFHIRDANQIELASGTINDAEITKGLYQVENINLTNIEEIKNKKTLYVELGNALGQSLPAKGTVSLTLPKVSSIKVDGNNKTGRNNVSVSFKITGDADSYELFWLDGDTEASLTDGLIDEEKILKSIYTIDMVDISQITEIKKKKNLYIRLTNEVGSSKPTKATVSLTLPTLSSINLGNKNKTENNILNAQLKVTGNATKISVYSDPELKNSIKTFSLIPPADTKGYITLKNIDITQAENIKGRKMIYFTATNDVGTSKPIRARVTLIGPKLTKMNINSGDSSYTEGDTVSVEHQFLYSATHYRVSPIPFADLHDSQANDWLTYSANISVSNFKSEMLYLQLKNEVNVSNVIRDSIKINLIPEEWQGSWQASKQLTSSNFNFTIETSDLEIFHFQKTAVEKLLISDGLGNKFEGEFNDLGIFEATAYDSKRKLHMTISGRLDDENMALSLDCEYSEHNTQFRYNLALTRANNHIEDFSRKILILSPLIQEEFSRSDSTEEKYPYTYNSSYRICSFSKKGNNLEASVLNTGEKFFGQIHGKSFSLQMHKSAFAGAYSEKISGLFEEDGTISGHFSSELHRTKGVPLHYWSHGTIDSNLYTGETDIAKGNYSVSNLDKQMTQSSLSYSAFMADQAIFNINGTSVKINLSGTTVSGKIYDGWFSASNPNTQIFGRIEQNGNLTSHYIYSAEDIFEIGNLNGKLW